MIKVIFLFLSLMALSVFSKTVTGIVTVGKSVEKEVIGGTLFVFAKKAGSKPGDGQMPIAVQRIQNPVFPAIFKLSEANAMVKGTPFVGPFVISARYSVTGNATDKTGLEGSTPPKKEVKVGDSDIMIELKKKN